jgi:hypothetical protein
MRKISAKVRKFSQKDRTALAHLASRSISLREDWHRRLANAAGWLARNDPNWWIWLEREIPKHPRRSLIRVTRMLESRVRALNLKDYGYLGRQPGDVIFWEGLIVNDAGHLQET